MFSAASCAQKDARGTTVSDTGSTKSTQQPAPNVSREPAADAQPKRLSLVFVGTSLTAGLGLEPDSAYPMQIQRKIDSAGLPFEVTNAGVSGETTSGLLDRLDWIMRGKPDVIVLESGANDGLRGLPVAAVRTNLQQALTRLHAVLPATRVVLVQMEVLPNLGPQYAREFHAVYPELAAANHVTLLPFLLRDVGGRRDLNQGDGIHPNYEGERIVANDVWRSLEPVLRNVAKRRVDRALSRG